MLIAYHGREADKTAILSQLKAHREADDLVQRYGYWEDGKGCAVGCTLHSDDHMEYETRFGIPVAIARLEDSIFEGLPVDLARAWPERLMSAIRPGSDLSRVHWHLLHWLAARNAAGAASTARSAAWVQISDRLIALIEAAPDTDAV